MALTGTKALQVWCQRVTSSYHNVKVENMTKSWKDGMAFCAIIHHYRPELIDFNSLSKDNIRENNTLAFEVAERELGIPALLDPEDMVSMPSPDKLSILTYLSQYYNYFKDKKPDPDAATKDVGVSEKGKEFRKRSLKMAKDKENKKVTSEGGPLPAKISMKSDKCEICGKRVYLVERQVVDGRLFHRNCFRCTKCRNTLRPDSYKLTKDPKKFECMCHSDGNGWNMRMNVTNRAAARLATVGTGGSIWESRAPKSQLESPAKTQQQSPAKPATLPGPVVGNSKFHVPPVTSTTKPPAPNAVPMHPHLMAAAAARARFNAKPSATPQEPGPHSSPQQVRKQENRDEETRRGLLNSLAAVHGAGVTTSQESLSKSDVSSSPKPVPLPRNTAKSQENSGLDVKQSVHTAEEPAMDKMLSDSSSEDTKESETNRESSMFSTDDETRSSVDVRSLQEGDTLSSIGKESRDSTGFESSDLDNTFDRFNKAYRDSSRQESDQDAMSTEESTTVQKPVPIGWASTAVGEDVKEEGEKEMQGTEETVGEGKLENEETEQNVEIQGKEENEDTLNKVNEVVSEEQEKDNLDIVTNDVTNKSVEEGSSGDSALWDTKAELSDSYQDDINEIVDVEKTEKSEPKLDDKKEKDQPEKVSTKAEEKIETEKNIESMEKQKDDSQIEGVIEPSDKTSPGEEKKGDDVNYDVSLNPFASEEELEEGEEGKKKDIQPAEISDRRSTNPFDSDDDTKNGYDETLNPFGDEEKEESQQSEGSSVNPFTGSPIEDSPLSLRIKNLDSRPASYSFSYSERPERPPPPLLSSGSYSVKTRSQILEEMKRDRETLRSKKRQAPAPPSDDGSTEFVSSKTRDGSVRVPPRARKSRKAPQPPQGSPAKTTNGDVPALPEKLKQDRDSAPSTPTPAPRVAHPVTAAGDGTMTTPQPSPRLRKVQKPERPPPPRLHSVNKRRAPAPPPIKREVGKDHIDVSLIQHELVQIESKQRELEETGIELEKKLRQDTDGDAAHDDILLVQWFEVVNEKNKLVRREGELVAQAQQQELELQHADIEYELRVLLQKADHERVDADAEREEQLLEMLVEVVSKRNQIVERLEEDRLREEAEDEDILALMQSSNMDRKKEGSKGKKHKKKGKLGLVK